MLDDLEKYIKDFLIKLNPNISFIKNQISVLLKKYNFSSQYENWVAVQYENVHWNTKSTNRPKILRHRNIKLRVENPGLSQRRLNVSDGHPAHDPAR